MFNGGLRSLYSCGVSVPGLRFVDVANGVLGIEWVNGKSVRFLLGSGDEGEDADGDEDVVEDPLIEYGVSKGTFFHDVHPRTPIFLMGREQKY
jgi:TP53 regulating kinase-like protein